MFGEKNEMRITAHQLAVIIDTINQSLVISNWSGVYTHKSREDVRNAIAGIMNEMSVEINTDKAELPGDCQGGYLK
jgi:hypothetical protein